MVLASGLVALGGAHAWRRVDAPWPGAAGGRQRRRRPTRPYAGWFLASAAVPIVLHATVRDAKRSLERRRRARLRVVGSPPPSP